MGTPAAAGAHRFRLDSGSRLTPDVVPTADRDGHPDHDAFEVPRQGPEILLPVGRVYPDEDGEFRRFVTA